MGLEQFSIFMQSISWSTLVLVGESNSSTKVSVMGIRYLAVDSAVPYHINAFDNLPINHTDGPLAAFNLFTPSPVTYLNTINYTA